MKQTKATFSEVESPFNRFTILIVTLESQIIGGIEIIGGVEIIGGGLDIVIIINNRGGGLEK